MLFFYGLEPYSFPRKMIKVILLSLMFNFGLSQTSLASESGLMGSLKIVTTITVEEIRDEYTNNETSQWRKL